MDPVFIVTTLFLIAIVILGIFLAKKNRSRVAANLDDTPTPDREDRVSETKRESGEEPLLIKVQTACQIAYGSADFLSDDYEKERFNKFINSALDIARSIDDEFYRSAALHEIIDTLTAAGQIERGKALLPEIEVSMILKKAQGLVSERDDPNRPD